MNTRSCLLLGLGLSSAGLLNSCKSEEYLYNKAFNKQYEIAAKERNLINTYGGQSTLIPNGNLSSVMGNNVLFFASKADSTRFDAQVRLGNAYVTKAKEEGQKAISKLSTISAGEQYSILNVAQHQEFTHNVNKAVKKRKQIIRNACKDKGVVVIKNAAKHF